MDEYPISVFSDFFNTTVTYKSMFFDLKKTIINSFLTNSIYRKIIKRYAYYYSNPDCIAPIDNCLVKTVRKYITHIPNVYHYDFRGTNIDAAAKKEIIMNFKKRYSQTQPLNYRSTNDIFTRINQNYGLYSSTKNIRKCYSFLPNRIVKAQSAESKVFTTLFETSSDRITLKPSLSTTKIVPILTENK